MRTKKLVLEWYDRQRQRAYNIWFKLRRLISNYMRFLKLFSVLKLFYQSNIAVRITEYNHGLQRKEYKISFTRNWDQSPEAKLLYKH